MKNTYHLLFEYFPLNQKQKCFDNWIQHIKSVGKHLFNNSYALTHEELISNQNYSSDKMMVQVYKTLIIYC